MWSLLLRASDVIFDDNYWGYWDPWDETWYETWGYWDPCDEKWYETWNEIRDETWGGYYFPIP